MKNRGYFFYYLILGSLLSLSAGVIYLYARTKSKIISTKLAIINKQLEKEIINSKRIYFYTDLNYFDSTYYALNVDSEFSAGRNQINFSQTGTNPKSEIYCFFLDEWHNLEYPTKYDEFNLDSVIINYVKNEFSGHDLIKLCPLCYHRHKKEFDKIIDSIYKAE